LYKAPHELQVPGFGRVVHRRPAGVVALAHVRARVEELVDYPKLVADARVLRRRVM